ncbi:MAG: hydroxymethylglutaryl-CoA reductase [Bacteriovoracaceae bacterium]|nr:hydroxymethylglutaryl-CoA reductase [Bacteriovoracaceae bacterium]
MKPISGFSKLSKEEKINFLVDVYLGKSESTRSLIQGFWHNNTEDQKVFDEFSENTISNFYFPYGVVPNMMINQKLLCVPMVIEESSVVAACSKAAKFWLNRGGFNAKVISTTKNGQVHFIWKGDSDKLKSFFESVKEELINSVSPLVKNMEARGGGLLDIKLIDRTSDEPDYYQLWGDFETCDAMGANFINTILEALGNSFTDLVKANSEFQGEEKDLQVIMAILSNYTPECVVEAWVECPIEELQDPASDMSSQEFIEKFSRAIRISKIDVNRATTHNKGIFNGIDAVILATGNDFRAIEACGHTWASRHGKYQGLTDVTVNDGKFRFSLKLPLSLGTVGGLTALHPLARTSLEMLGHPNAKELMEVSACIGLAQNFAALRSLVTTGIQKGHMKMHLMNILNHLEANDEERKKAKLNFSTETISYQAVRDFINSLRQYH